MPTMINLLARARINYCDTELTTIEFLKLRQGAGQCGQASWGRTPRIGYHERGQGEKASAAGHVPNGQS